MLSNSYISDLWYYQFQPFVVLSGNCIYIGFSKHPIYIFINFVSLLVLVVLLLSVLRVLCLSLMVALIYSGAVLITFIFVVMTFDQSDILCIPSYKFTEYTSCRHGLTISAKLITRVNPVNENEGTRVVQPIVILPYLPWTFIFVIVGGYGPVCQLTLVSY